MLLDWLSWSNQPILIGPGQKSTGDFWRAASDNVILFFIYGIVSLARLTMFVAIVTCPTLVY